MSAPEDNPNGWLPAFVAAAVQAGDVGTIFGAHLVAHSSGKRLVIVSPEGATDGALFVLEVLYPGQAEVQRLPLVFPVPMLAAIGRDLAERIA